MKTFEFSKKGLKECSEYVDYIGMAKNTLTEHPELFPLALLGVLGLSALIINPMASMVAYKTGIDSSIIAFKYLGGF